MSIYGEVDETWCQGGLETMDELVKRTVPMVGRAEVMNILGLKPASGRLTPSDYVGYR